MHIFFFKIAVNSKAFEFSDRFEQNYRIPGKPSNGFGNHEVDLSVSAVLHHSLEFWPFYQSAGDSVV